MAALKKICGRCEAVNHSKCHRCQSCGFMLEVFGTSTSTKGIPISDKLIAEIRKEIDSIRFKSPEKRK